MLICCLDIFSEIILNLRKKCLETSNLSFQSKTQVENLRKEFQQTGISSMNRTNFKNFLINKLHSKAMSQCKNAEARKLTVFFFAKRFRDDWKLDFLFWIMSNWPWNYLKIILYVFVNTCSGYVRILWVWFQILCWWL